MRYDVTSFSLTPTPGTIDGVCDKVITVCRDKESSCFEHFCLAVVLVQAGIAVQ